MGLGVTRAIALIMATVLVFIMVGCGQSTTPEDTAQQMGKAPSALMDSDVAQLQSALMAEIQEGNRASAELTTQVLSLSDTIAVLAEAVRSLEAGASPEPAAAAPTQIPAASGSAVATPGARPTVSAPSIAQASSSDMGRNICYRAIGVQQAIFDRVDGPELCAAISVGELYRLRGLSVRVDNGPGNALRREDFADMPNLTHLGLEIYEDDDHEMVYGELPTDVFAELTALQVLGISSGNPKPLGKAAFASLPTLEELSVTTVIKEDEALPSQSFNGLSADSLSLKIHKRYDDDTEQEYRRFTLPNDLFSGSQDLRNLHIGIDTGGSYDCVDLGEKTFAGLTGLEVLVIDAHVRRIPFRAFEDLTELNVLQVGACYDYNTGNQVEHEIYVADYEVALRLLNECDNCSKIAGVVGQ